MNFSCFNIDAYKGPPEKESTFGEGRTKTTSNKKRLHFVTPGPASGKCSLSGGNFVPPIFAPLFTAERMHSFLLMYKLINLSGFEMAIHNHIPMKIWESRL